MRTCFVAFRAEICPTCAWSGRRLAPAWGATLELLSLNDLIAKSTAIVQAQVTWSSAVLQRHRDLHAL